MNGSTTVRDPVCGMEIEPAKAAGQSSYGDNTYYFCSSSCKAKFDADPPRYTDTHKLELEEASHHGEHKHAHSDHSLHYSHQANAVVQPSFDAKYFCPMDAEVVSDKPDSCQKCGMALELNPAWKSKSNVIYTCPMHPEIEQDHPGTCPKCGMALELKTVSAESEEDDSELRRMNQRF